MTPVMQQFRHDPPRSYGDCYRAAMASLLDYPLHLVPHFMRGLGDSDGDEFNRRQDEFLRRERLDRVVFPVAAETLDALFAAAAAWNLWGDVPALMPAAGYGTRMKYGKICHSPEGWIRVQNGAEILHPHTKIPGFRFDGSGRSFQSAAVDGLKGIPHRPAGHWTNQAEHDGVKHHGSGEVWFDTGPAGFSSRSLSRKAASAMIAKIPLPLARHIARTFHP